MITADFTRGKNQAAYFNTVMGAVSRYLREQAGLLIKSAKRFKDPKPLRIFAYGGAVNGGKTYVSLALLVLLCRLFPGSRWHVIRASMPDLIRTVEESMKELLRNTTGARWRRSRGDVYVEFRNGSRIYFMAENFARDPDLNRFKGLQTNGVLLEQVEELQQETFMKCIERVGRFYIPKMPPPMVFMTFNPAFNWVKEQLYDRWKDGTLPPTWHYQEALPKDLPFVTQEQWSIWQNLDKRTYQRFIEGLWEIDLDGRFAHAFTSKKHKGRVEYDPAWPLYISFDFNVDPSCAVAFQTDGETFFRGLKEYRIKDGDTHKLCDAVRKDWYDLNPDVWVCGDASGRARMSGVRGAVSQYHIIQAALEIPWERFLVPTTNPFVADSRVLLNSVIEHIEEFMLDDSMTWTIHDLNFVVIKRDHMGLVQIQKTGKLKHVKENAKSMGHLLDCVRYGVHVAFPNFVRHKFAA